MKRNLWMLTLILLGLLTACFGSVADAQPPPEVGGPALLMFYTDN